MKKQIEQSKSKNNSQNQQLNKKNLDPNKNNNPNKNQKLDFCNFERLYSEIIEVQSDIETQLKGTQDFFTSYMNSIICPDEITKILKIIEYNSSYQEKLAEKFKKHLLEDLSQNSSKAKKSTKITKQIETKTYQVARAKDMYRELNQMCHADIISHKKEIKKITELTKAIHDEIAEYEKEIKQLNIDNKNTYSEELNLLDTVMNFDKKLYTIYVTREEKKKEKQNVQNEIQKILEEKKAKENSYKEQLDIITKKKKEIQENFEKEKQKLENLISMHPTKIENFNNIFNKLKEFHSKKLLELKNIKENTEMLDANYQNQKDNDLKNYIKECDANIVKNLFETVENIQNLFPFLQIPNNITDNSNINIIDISESLNKQMLTILNEETPQEKINREKENQISELGLKIADIYHEKFIKKLFLSSLKFNAIEEKRRKEAEKKLQELKNKEEQLKFLQMKYINEQESKKNLEKVNEEKRIINNGIKNQIIFEKEDREEEKEDKEEKEEEREDKEEEKEDKEEVKKDHKEEEKKEKKEGKEEKEKVDKEEEKMEEVEKIKEKREDRKEERMEERIEDKREDFERKKERNMYRRKDKKHSINKRQNKNKKHRQYKYDKKNKESKDINSNYDNNNNSQFNSQEIIPENKDEQDLYNLVNEFEKSQKKKQEQKQNTLFQTEKNDNKKKKLGYFSNNFGDLEGNNEKSINPFDLNDLNFLTELGENLNKTDKNYGFGRKNYRK